MRGPGLLALAALTASLVLTGGVMADEALLDTHAQRVNNRSPLFRVPAGDVAYWMNYTGYATAPDGGEPERRYREGIGPKVLEMIRGARTHVILSVFLFDSFYAEGPVERDIVGVLQDALIHQRRMHPDLHVALILDPSHSAYGDRVSPAERALRDAGVDVFYSDLLADLKKASALGVRENMGQLGRLADRLTGNAWGALSSAVLGAAKLPKRFDDERISLETAYNAALMKANHRKLLVCDVHGQNWEALVTSANPHNASAYHINSAVSVRGAPARYIYNVLREDMQQSAGLGRRFAHWHIAADRAYRRTYFQDAFPPLPPADGNDNPRAAEAAGVGVRFVTESAIRDAVIAMLLDVRPEDEVRIQMFYLSFQPVLDAILDASTVVDQPLRLLLDANKDSFNREKDGTPNRQVARYLLRESAARGGKLAIRWYTTHGEQNHAKTLSVTGARDGRCRLTTGSANWTGRNLDGVNMESNLVIENAPRVNADFNALFDRFWSNADGLRYSQRYEDFAEAASDAKWRRGEKPWYLSTF
jgi:hypothetical protein